MIENRARLIPAVSILDRRLVKTTRFRDPRYLGDPINAVRLYNDFEVDELCVLDIGATRSGTIDFDYLEELVAEAFMPVSYGGGVSRVADAERLVQLGVEKVILSSHALLRRQLVREISDSLGASSTVVCVDVRKQPLDDSYIPYLSAGLNQGNVDLIEYLVEVQEAGAGEIIVTDIERDGTMSGLNLPLIEELRRHVSVPLLFSGGTADISDYGRAVSLVMQ
ncbi:putative imidazole glycerol phosphate synthase subunit hisF2 [Geobacter hydrogenophilus]|uniref:Imidazole glycerol phosphate synthase subunit hisF2 n=2 Tax=Geobacter hydrogenophilus TaxID=40983 RepID=A0A9W6FXL3_9BACT|nr:putative imidazole glycerol phosphate synthase subunit hisF2 [Geobacter hydrogenophilus]